jgi:hypothetical protein
MAGCCRRARSEELEARRDRNRETGQGITTDVVVGRQPGGEAGAGWLGDTEGGGDIAHEVGDESTVRSDVSV